MPTNANFTDETSPPLNETSRHSAAPGPFNWQVFSWLNSLRGLTSVTIQRRSQGQNAEQAVQLRIGTRPSFESEARTAPQETSTSTSSSLTTDQLADQSQVQGVADQNGLETLGSAAERHRLSSSSQEINLEAVVHWVERCLPFMALLLVVFLYHHFAGLMLFIWLTLGLIKMDGEIRKQVAAKGDYSGMELAGGVVYLAAHIAVVFYLLSDYQLWASLILVAPAKIPSVWDALYRISVLDLVIRYTAIIIKAGILAACKCVPDENFKRRSQKLTLVEHAVQLYRVLVPAPIWYRFFRDAALGFVLSYSCTGLYFMFKSTMLYEKAGLVGGACRAAMRSDTAVGSRPTQEEIMEAGSNCAICQEPMSVPVKLQCSHIFCDSCISEWFERERTCPMCRAVVKPAGLNSFGDGSTGLLPQLF